MYEFLCDHSGYINIGFTETWQSKMEKMRLFSSPFKPSYHAVFNKRFNIL